MMLLATNVECSHRVARRRRLLLVGLGACLFTACAHGRSARSYLPVGAGAQYGATTNDGVTWTLPYALPRAVDSVRTLLHAAGYAVEDAAPTARRLRTTPRVVGGDTALVVCASFLDLAPAAVGTSIVLTGTYSVPSRQIRDAPVLQRANTTDPLYARLRALAAATRTTR